MTLEGSAFHGREPDENRWNIDQGRIDSYSGRLTIRSFPGFSLQVSSGHLEHPEAVETANQTRTTASATYQRGDASRFFAATLAVGENRTREGPEWGKLFEWTWKFAGKSFVNGRLESVDRDAYELVHKRQRPGDVPADRVSVQAATLGFTRDFAWLSEAETGIGADVTIYRFPSRFDFVYGSRPVSLHGFLRIRFGSHEAEMSAHSHQM
jgi:hypothetical protein